MTMYRQGDVLVVRIESLPNQATPLAPEAGRVILAHGEATGHCHSVDATVARLFAVSGVEDRFLEVAAPVALLHQEHDAITLEPGIYRIVRQREYSDEDEIRRVAD